MPIAWPGEGSPALSGRDSARFAKRRAFRTVRHHTRAKAAFSERRDGARHAVVVPLARDGGGDPVMEGMVRGVAPLGFTEQVSASKERQARLDQVQL